MSISFRHLSVVARVLAVAVAIALVPAGAARCAETIRTANAIIEFGEGDRSRAEVVPRVLDAIRCELRDGLGLDGPDVIRVGILRDARAFSRSTGGVRVELYAGLATPSAGTIAINAAAMDRTGGQTAFVRTLRHEYVHLALGTTLRGKRVPKWFEEGLACAFGSPLPREDALLVAGGRGYRLSVLRDRFPPTKDGLALAYAQAESVVRYLVSQASNRGVRETLRLVASGRPFDAALKEATGFTVEALEESWRLRSQPSRIERTLRAVFGPGRVLLWTALFMVGGFFVVKYRRRRAAERLDDYI